METDNQHKIDLDEGLGIILESVLRGRLDGVTVGIVESFDKDKQTVKVQPAIRRLLDNETEYKQRQLVTDVRVIFQGSGDWVSTCPINQGDPILLLAPARDLDNWMEQGGIADPRTDRIFDLSDAVAIPGVLNDAAVIPDFQTDGFYIRKKDGSVHLKVADDGVSTKGDLSVEGNISATGDISAEGDIGTETGSIKTTTGDIEATAGDVVASQVSLSTHTHTAPAGGGATSPPIPTP